MEMIKLVHDMYDVKSTRMKRKLLSSRMWFSQESTSSSIFYIDSDYESLNSSGNKVNSDVGTCV